MFRRLSVAGALAAIVLVASVAPVAAHAELVRATPGPDDTLTTVPPRLEATFSQDLDPSRSSLELRAADGSRLARESTAGTGRRALTLALPALSSGTYEIRWTTFSTEDQELARGTYTFTVEAPTPTATPPAATISPEPSASSTASASTQPSVPAPTATATGAPAAPTPAASTSVAPGTPTADGGAGALVPVFAALVVVAVFGYLLLRRRRA